MDLLQVHYQKVYISIFALGLSPAVLWLFSSALPVARAAGPWYVDPAGSDTSSCTASGPAAACKTISATISKAFAGDIINIAAGTYTENRTVPQSLTFSGNQATWDGYGGTGNLNADPPFATPIAATAAPSGWPVGCIFWLR